jgi:Fur family transcriptional regulator, ferric uptake regulator
MTHHATRTLHEQGYRLTPQRTLVWDVLRAQSSHVSAEDICTQVQRQFPYINISTVYRTLELLVDLHLVRETRLGPTRRYFEVEEDEPHHHLVCDSCGKVIHVHDADLGTLDGALSQDPGFLIREVTVFGLCKDCQACTSPTDS